MKTILLLWLLGITANLTIYLAITATQPQPLHLSWTTWACGIVCYTPAILVTAKHRKHR